MLPPNVSVGVGIARPPRPQRARRRPRLRSQVVGRPQMGLPTPAHQTVHPAARPAALQLLLRLLGIAYAPPPQTSAGADIRTGANEAWAGAQNSWRDSVYRAAMQLGDPTAIARLRQIHSSLVIRSLQILTQYSLLLIGSKKKAIWGLTTALLRTTPSSQDFVSTIDRSCQMRLVGHRVLVYTRL
jgi:hypothetical protein